MNNTISTLKTFFYNFSFMILPIFYVFVLAFLVTAIISKYDIATNLKFVQKSKFFGKLKNVSVTDFIIMICVFLYTLIFVSSYNYASKNLLVSFAILMGSFLISYMLKTKKNHIKFLKSYQFVNFFYTIALFILVSNMFAYPEAFSIEKPGNIDLVKIIILATVSMVSGLVIAKGYSYAAASRRNFKMKNKFKNRSFFNKILIVLILNAFILLLFTEAEFACKMLLVFAFILGCSMCKKFTEEDWQIVNKSTTLSFAFLMCLSAIFIGNIFLTIISAVIMGISFKEFSQNSFNELAHILKASFLCRPRQ